jgi:DNA-binding NarL/FixJ family response regulator
MAPLRILLANHYPIIRSSLRLLLEREPEFQVVGEAANGREAVVLADYRHPDIVLLEVKLPHLNGIAAAREIASKEGCSQVVFVTTHTDEGYVGEAFRAGARGYVLGDAAPTDLPQAIRAVISSRLFLSPALSRQLLEGSARGDSKDGDLSERQKELCCLLAAGYSEEEMGQHLHREFPQLQADLQAVSDALERRRMPEVLRKTIWENQHLLEQAGR